MSDLYASILNTLDELFEAHLRLELPPDRREMAEYRAIVERIEAIMIEGGPKNGG